MQAVAAEPRAAFGWDPGAAPAALLLGVLASDARLAVRALRDFCGALRTDFLLPAPSVRPVMPQGLPRVLAEQITCDGCHNSWAVQPCAPAMQCTATRAGLCRV